jgi:hypothetical protein
LHCLLRRRAATRTQASALSLRPQGKRRRTDVEPKEKITAVQRESLVETRFVYRALEGANIGAQAIAERDSEYLALTDYEIVAERQPQTMQRLTKCVPRARLVDIAPKKRQRFVPAGLTAHAQEAKQRQGLSCSKSAGCLPMRISEGRRSQQDEFKGRFRCCWGRGLVHRRGL